MKKSKPCEPPHFQGALPLHAHRGPCPGEQWHPRGKFDISTTMPPRQEAFFCKNDKLLELIATMADRYSAEHELADAAVVSFGETGKELASFEIAFPVGSQLKLITDNLKDCQLRVDGDIAIHQPLDPTIVIFRREAA